MLRRAFLTTTGASLVAGPAWSGTAIWQSAPEPVQRIPPRSTARERVGDVEIYYETYGKGRPLILLHDALGNAGHWANQVGPFSLDRQVVALDSRGHGRSTRGHKPIGYRQMAEDVFELMHKLRLEDATVVGWGDGAIVGLDLAMRHTGWIRNLVMFGGNYSLAGLKPGAQKTPTFAAYVRKSIADYKALAGEPDLDALMADLQAMWKTQPAYEPEDLRTIRTGVTVIYAEHDETVTSDHAREMARLIPGAQLVMLPGLSHFAPWQDSRRFNEAVLGALG